MTRKTKDHGGGLDTVIAQYGGAKSEWVELSTGINPAHYPIPDLKLSHWTQLPDTGAFSDIESAARQFWNVPKDAKIVVSAGVSAIIAQLPNLITGKTVTLYKPTYNEFEAAFCANGWSLENHGDVQVYIHPNNPDGQLTAPASVTKNHKSLTVIDESFCDTCPDQSLINFSTSENHIVLKGLGKFWGLAGLRLGFAITTPELAQKLETALGPWAASGPALAIGASALRNHAWAAQTRNDLATRRERLDTILQSHGFKIDGGTDLFRLVDVGCAQQIYDKLCRHKILTRIFPYSTQWIRFGVPNTKADFDRLNHALGQ